MILKSTDPNEIPDYTKSNSVEFNFFIHFKVFFIKKVIQIRNDKNRGKATFIWSELTAFAAQCLPFLMIDS